MNPSYLRQFHASQIFHVLRENPDISQRDLCRLTGCDKSTVSVIIKKLESVGLVERIPGEQSATRTRGRPLEKLRISVQSGFLMGVHLAFDTIHLVAATIDGQPLGMVVMPLSTTPDGLLENITDGLEQLAQRIDRPVTDIRGIGVSVPDLITTQGNAAHLTKLGWGNIDIEQLIRTRIPVSVNIDNDDNAMTLAEHIFGSCRGIDDFLLIESGTGIGGGLFLDGRVYRGKNGFAGELGHIKVVNNGRICGCGAMGCLSAYLSDGVLLERARKITPSITSIDILIQQAESGTPALLGLLDEAGAYLGIALSNTINIFNPPTLVLSGTLARIWPFIKHGLFRSLNENTLADPLAETRIIISTLSVDPIPRGGIALALEGFTRLDSDAAPW